MSSHSVLDELDRYRRELERSLLDPDQVVAPANFEAERLLPHELERAQLALAEIARLHERVTGLRTRLAGELAGMRRTSRETHRRAPWTLDTVI